MAIPELSRPPLALLQLMPFTWTSVSVYTHVCCTDVNVLGMAFVLCGTWKDLDDVAIARCTAAGITLLHRLHACAWTYYI